MAHLVAETRRYITIFYTFQHIFFFPPLTLSTKTIKGRWRITVVPIFLAVRVAVNRRDAQTSSYFQECGAPVHHVTGGLIIIIRHGRREDRRTHTHTHTHTHTFSNQTHLTCTHTHKAFPRLSLVLVVIEDLVNSWWNKEKKNKRVYFAER